jgi:hypothetical protein
MIHTQIKVHKYKQNFTFVYYSSDRLGLIVHYLNAAHLIIYIIKQNSCMTLVFDY